MDDEPDSPVEPDGLPKRKPFQFGLASLFGLMVLVAIVSAILPASVLSQTGLAAIYVMIVPLGGGLLIGWLLGLGKDP